MNKLKDKSEKRMEHSNKLLEEYKAINDKIDTNIEKSKKQLGHHVKLICLQKVLMNLLKELMITVKKQCTFR